MQNFKLSPSETTPFIDMNSNNGEITITGRSIVFHAQEFWNPILKWFFNYMDEPRAQTTLNIQLEHINSASTVQMMKLLKLASINFTRGKNTKVVLHIDIEDEDGYELGVELKKRLRLPLIIQRFETKISNKMDSPMIALCN